MERQICSARPAYDSDLTAAQWELIVSCKPAAKQGKTGRPPKYERREIWNAIFYQARTGTKRVRGASGATFLMTSRLGAWFGSTSDVGARTVR